MKTMLTKRQQKLVQDEIHKANALYDPIGNPHFPSADVMDSNLVLILFAGMDIDTVRRRFLPADRTNEDSSNNTRNQSCSQTHLVPAPRTVTTFGVPTPEFLFAKNSVPFEKFFSKRVPFYLLTKLAHLFYKSGIFLLQVYYFFRNKHYQIAYKKGLVRYVNYIHPAE